jgi:HK97 family phage portal protein
VNLLDTWRGLSPLSPAARPADIHNAGARWNAKLLQNSARPSGIVEMTGSPNETLLDRMREHFKKAWQGSNNVGEVGLLTGGAKFTAMSMNPKDMEFILGMNAAAKDIALVYGVPLPLVTTDAATFSNMDSALERLWMDTVLPLLDEVIAAMSGFIAPLFGKNLQLIYNADSVPALELRRQRLYERMGKAVGAGLVTPDEAREEMGFGPVGGMAASLLVPSSLTPLQLVGAETQAQNVAKAMKAAGIPDGEVTKVLAEA